MSKAVSFLTPTSGYMPISSPGWRNPRNRQVYNKSTNSANYLDLASPSSIDSACAWTWDNITVMVDKEDPISTS